MFCIDKNNRITLTRGDTATMYVQAFDLDNQEYTIQSGDTVTMTIRKTDSSPIILQKTADSDHYITIGSSDTAELDCGNYIYDVQLTTSTGYIYTIIPKNYFQLAQEVTYGS